MPARWRNLSFESANQKARRSLDSKLKSRIGLSTNKMVKVMARIISPLMMKLLNQDAMIIQNVIFIVKVRF